MNKSNLTPSIVKKLRDLEDKYSLTGQDLMSNLEGLEYSNYLKYWDYIHLDTLLSLQNPRTDFPDEHIFIVYHQITELYFNLILWEIKQVTSNSELSSKFFLDRLGRLNRYFKHLSNSFEIMTDGMDFGQFQKFRMALLPASGFQSAQFRYIEICSTDFYNLLNKNYQNMLTEKAKPEDIYPFIYWKEGATDQKTGKETITSIHFQKQYSEEFVRLGNEYRKKNLWQTFLKIKEDDNTEQIKDALKQYDLCVNVDWRLAHFKSAVRYLRRGDQPIDATGGTNWQKYLPPRFQKLFFFPELWTEEEKANWGKAWVEKQLKDEQ